MLFHARLAHESLSATVATGFRLRPMYLIEVAFPVILVEDCTAFGASYSFFGWGF